MASLVSFTPVASVVVTTSTRGCTFFHVIEAVKPHTASSASSNAPFQWVSRMPPHRSMGLSVLW